MEAIEIIVIGWGFFALFFALVIFLGNVLQRRVMYDKLGSSQLTVIVPFRNEETRIQSLLQSLKRQVVLPHHIYFVNDHSSDNALQLINDALNDSSCAYTVLSLASDQSGKKMAICEGVQQANTPFCLTLDADITLPPDYFLNLPELGDFSMVCLPVRMEGQDVMGKLMELEYGSFQLLQGAVNENKPLMASGANLLINRTDYLNYNDLSTHQHIASGDDQFALAQLMKKGKKVRYSLRLDQTVYTEVPHSIGELLAQRTRWMGNNTEGNDWRATFFATWVLMVNVGFLSLFIASLVQHNFPMAFQLFVVKFTLDFITYFTWFKRHQKWELVLLLPILQILYPMYLIIIGFSYLFQKRTWKERSIK